MVYQAKTQVPRHTVRETWVTGGLVVYLPARKFHYSTWVSKTPKCEAKAVTAFYLWPIVPPILVPIGAMVMKRHKSIFALFFRASLRLLGLYKEDYPSPVKGKHSHE